MKHFCQKTYSWLASLFLAVMFAVSGSANAQDVTINLYGDKSSTLEESGIRVEGYRYSNMTNLWGYTTLYIGVIPGGELDGRNITKIQFTEYYNQEVNVICNTGSWNAASYTWTGDDPGVTFSTSNNNDDYYFTEVKIWLGEGGGEVPPVVNPGGDETAFQLLPGSPVMAESGSHVESISKYLSFSIVPGPARDHTAYNGDPVPAGVTMTSNKGGNVAIEQFNYWADADWQGNYQLGVVLAREITEDGVWTLHIPAGTIELAAGGYNAEAEYVFIIGEEEEPVEPTVQLYTIKRASDGLYLTTNAVYSGSNYEPKETYEVSAEPEYFTITPAETAGRYFIQSENGKNVGVYPYAYDWNVKDYATEWQIADIEGGQTQIINTVILNYKPAGVYGLGFDSGSNRIFSDKTGAAIAYWVIEKVAGEEPVIPETPVTFEFAENEDGNIVVTPSDLEHDYVVFYIPAAEEDYIDELVAEEIALAGGDYFTGEFEISLAQFTEMGVFGDFIVVAAGVDNGAVCAGGIHTYPFTVAEVVRPLSFDIFVDGNDLTIEPSKDGKKYWWTIVSDETSEGMNDEVYFEYTLQGKYSFDLIEGNTYADLTPYLTKTGEYRVLVGEVVPNYRGFGLGGELFTKVINYVEPVEPEPVYGEDGTATFSGFYEYSYYDEPITVEANAQLYGGLLYQTSQAHGITITADEGYAIAKVEFVGTGAHYPQAANGNCTYAGSDRATWEFDKAASATFDYNYQVWNQAAISSIVVDYVALNVKPVDPVEPDPEYPEFGDGVAEVNSFAGTQTVEGPVVISYSDLEGDKIFLNSTNKNINITATNGALISRVEIVCDNITYLSCAEGEYTKLNSETGSWSFDGVKSATFVAECRFPWDMVAVSKIIVEYTTPAPAGWAGEIKHLVAANEIDDLLDYEIEFVGAKNVKPCATDVLGAIYDETGNPYAIVYAGEMDLFGSLEIEGNKATVHFVKIADLNESLQAGVVAAAARLGGALAGEGNARVVFSGSSFVVDGKAVDFIQKDYVFGGLTTGIESIATENGNVIYDLSGRRVNNAQGNIFIMNSRKQYMK